MFQGVSLENFGVFRPAPRCLADRPEHGLHRLRSALHWRDPSFLEMEGLCTLVSEAPVTVVGCKLRATFV